MKRRSHGRGHRFNPCRAHHRKPRLVADPAGLVEAFRDAVATCIERDKAEAVIIGGGPLGNAAIALTPMFSIPVIAPIPAAVHRMLGLVRT